MCLNLSILFSFETLILNFSVSHDIILWLKGCVTGKISLSCRVFKSKCSAKSNKIKFLRQGLKTSFRSPFAYSYNPGQNCWGISMQFSMSHHTTIMSRRNKLAPLPTPGAMLLQLNSSSMHFLCYRKQHCNGGGGKQSFQVFQQVLSEVL